MACHPRRRREPSEDHGEGVGLQAPRHASTVAHVRPAWETAPELFGPDRLLWGSDWPVTVTCAGYAGTWQVLSTLVQELSPDEQEDVLGRTAVRVYGLRGVSSPSRDAQAEP